MSVSVSLPAERQERSASAAPRCILSTMCEVGPPPALPSQDPVQLKKAPFVEQCARVLGFGLPRGAAAEGGGGGSKAKDGARSATRGLLPGSEKLSQAFAVRSWIESGCDKKNRLTGRRHVRAMDVA